MDPVDLMGLIDHVEHRDFVDLIDLMQLVDYFDHMDLTAVLRRGFVSSPCVLRHFSTVLFKFT